VPSRARSGGTRRAWSPQDAPQARHALPRGRMLPPQPSTQNSPSTHPTGSVHRSVARQVVDIPERKALLSMIARPPGPAPFRHRRNAKSAPPLTMYARDWYCPTPEPTFRLRQHLRHSRFAPRLRAAILGGAREDGASPPRNDRGYPSRSGAAAHTDQTEEAECQQNHRAAAVAACEVAGANWMTVICAQASGTIVGRYLGTRADSVRAIGVAVAPPRSPGSCR